MNKQIKNKTFLITGGAGFVGSNIANYIYSQGGKVIIIDDLSTGDWDNILVPGDVYGCKIKGSITDKKLVNSAVSICDYVMHLAANCMTLSTKEVYTNMEVNIEGTVNVLEACKKHGIKQMLYTSTSSVYGNQTILPTPEDVNLNILSPYAASKLAAEHYCLVYHKMWGVPVSILRYSNVYGKGQNNNNPYCGVVSKFIKSKICDNVFNIHGDGLQTRDYTYIDDAVDISMMATLDPKAIGEIFNVGTGFETSVIDLANRIDNLTGPLELSAKIDYKENRDIDNIRRRAVNCEKARLHLGWVHNTPMKVGLQKTIEYIREKEINV